MADVEDLSNQLLGLAKQAGERFPDDDDEPSAAGYEGSGSAQSDEEAAAWLGRVAWLRSVQLGSK